MITTIFNICFIFASMGTYVLTAYSTTPTMIIITMSDNKSMTGPRILLVDRFWGKVHRGNPASCWLWYAAINKRGYGVIKLPGRNTGNMLAHRLSYTINVGKIPDGIFVCHHCDVPSCVNPNHLFLGTNKQNMQDCISKGRFVEPIAGVINRNKTHCINGHEFTPENTWSSSTMRQKNIRQCRTCARDRARMRRGYGLKPTIQEINRNKTHCSNGHEFTEDNTYRLKNGWRKCRQCHLDKL